MRVWKNYTQFAYRFAFKHMSWSPWKVA